MEVDQQQQQQYDDDKCSFTIVRPIVSEISNTSRPANRLSHVSFTSPGEEITTEDLSVRARGTLLSNDGNKNILTATVCGMISRVNKLVMVTPLRAKYIAEAGNVVIGRIIEISGKRWKLDINSTRHGILLLSSINLPGEMQQRRRNQDEELDMRMFYKEGDLASAQVKEIWNDGTAALHATRSLKYGKLKGGQLVVVQAQLVKRGNRHFHQLECGVHCILGNNGYVFLGQVEKKQMNHEMMIGSSPADQPIDEVIMNPNVEMRKRIARVRNCILALDKEFIAISAETIMDVYNMSISNGVELKDMMKPIVAKSICLGAKSMRQVA